MFVIRRVGETCRASIFLGSQLYFLLLVELLETREEEESGSGDQEQEGINSTGEVENRGTKKCNRRRHIVMIELHTPCNGERKDDEGICQGVT